MRSSIITHKQVVGKQIDVCMKKAQSVASFPVVAFVHAVLYVVVVVVVDGDGSKLGVVAVVVVVVDVGWVRTVVDDVAGDDEDGDPEQKVNTGIYKQCSTPYWL